MNAQEQSSFENHDFCTRVAKNQNQPKRKLNEVISGDSLPLTTHCFKRRRKDEHFVPQIFKIEKICKENLSTPSSKLKKNLKFFKFLLKGFFEMV